MPPGWGFSWIINKIPAEPLRCPAESEPASYSETATATASASPHSCTSVSLSRSAECKIDCTSVSMSRTAECQIDCPICMLPLPCATRSRCALAESQHEIYLVARALSCRRTENCSIRAGYEACCGAVLCMSCRKRLQQMSRSDGIAHNCARGSGVAFSVLFQLKSFFVFDARFCSSPTAFVGRRMILAASAARRLRSRAST